MRHPHFVSLEARQANLEGAGGVGLARLVREALRMRPDRLVVGEVREAESLDLLIALSILSATALLLEWRICRKQRTTDH